MRSIPIVLIALVLITSCEEKEKSYTGAMTATHDCAKEPNVSINSSDGMFIFISACERISINGSNNKVKIEAANKVGIKGGNNVVEMGAIDYISVHGSDNTVNYKKGLTRTSPNVVASGDNNTVVQMN